MGFGGGAAVTYVITITCERLGVHLPFKTRLTAIVLGGLAGELAAFGLLVAAVMLPDLTLYLAFMGATGANATAPNWLPNAPRALFSTCRFIAERLPGE